MTLRVLTPLLVFAGCGTVAMWQAVDARGSDMAYGYPMGYAIVLLFGALALWSASELHPRVLRPLPLAILCLAAVYAAFDAVHGLLIGRPIMAAAVSAAVCLALLALLFQITTARGWLLAVLVFLVKAIGAFVVEATLFTWFE